MQFKIQNFAAHSSKPYATLQVDRTIRCHTKDRLENFTMGRLCNIDRAFLNCTADRGTAGGVPSPRLSASWPTLVEPAAASDFKGSAVQSGAREVTLGSRFIAPAESCNAMSSCPPLSWSVLFSVTYT